VGAGERDASTAGALSDAELVRAAQAGDADCLGLLLARHAAPMRAVALSVLGYSPAVDDAVQDASLIALRRIGDLRDPQAAAPWLRAIVRNQCRMQLRARTAIPVGDVELLAPPSSEPDPGELLDHQALGDWVWHALHELPAHLRLVTMLRYFTDVTAYEQIAMLCDLPVGTVRSRLSHARARLAAGLSASADLAHDDAAARTGALRREGEQTLAAAHHGQFAAALAEQWSARLETTWPKGKRTKGFGYLVRAMDRDLADGVRHRLANVVASRDLIIWEAELTSPADDPFHCPPAVVWVQSLEAGRVRRLRLFHPRPTPLVSRP
jgi:RNA polymerase sigma factor (sigma-70 family)